MVCHRARNTGECDYAESAGKRMKKNTLALQLRECKNQAQRLNVLWYGSPSGNTEAQRLIEEARSLKELQSGGVPPRFRKLLPEWQRKLELRAGRFLINKFRGEPALFKKCLKDLDRAYKAGPWRSAHRDKLLEALLAIQLPILPSGKPKVV